MMNLISIRASAEARQHIAHQNRAYHRERQKKAEREDQLLKSLISVIDQLASIGVTSFVDDVSNTPAPLIVDSPAPLPIESPPDLNPVAAGETMPAAEKAAPLIKTVHTNIASPISPKAASVADKIMARFERERSGVVSSVEKIDILPLVGSSPLKLRKMLEALEAEGRIKVARSAEKSVVTVVFRDAVKEAAE